MTEPNQKKLVFFSKISVIALFSIWFYLFIRITTIITSHNNKWYETLSMIVLLLLEVQIMTFASGYFLNILRVLRNINDFTSDFKKTHLQFFPPVAVVLASYKEPLHVIRDTLVCFYNLNYPNKYLYLLDDTRYDLPWDTSENKLKYRKDVEDLCKELEINLFRANWHGAKAGIINDFNEFLNGKIRDDFEITYFSKKPIEPIKYLIIFDADMNPFPDFIDPLIDIMEKNPKVGFVQTPQYYTNFESNRVAWASGLQQAIFYEYICEGKNYQNAMFCCGTNVMFRKEAYDDVGGFEEESVTEDFATSLKFHHNGWSSVYLNKISAFGMGPEDLGGFFKQQFRWARGTLGVLMTLPKQDFSKFTRNQRWEYFLSAAHYLTGTTFFMLIIFPLFYIFFSVPSYVADPSIYLSSFLPYISLSILMYVWPLKRRKYKIREVLSVLSLNALTFPIFIRAAVTALFNMNTKFGITPKDGGSSLSLWAFKMQIITASLCTIGIVWGLQRMYYEKYQFYALFFNIIWITYNLVMISSFLYFNHGEEESKKG